VSAPVPRPSVLCAGIVVADIFVPPLASLPVAGELRATDDFLLAPGGCAANTAIVLSRLGVRAAVAGKVGQDVFGDFLEQDLRQRGIDTGSLSRSPHRSTSKTVVLTVEGEDRRFLHTVGANADFGVEDIDPSVIGRGDVFYVGGYFVLPGLEGGALADLCASARDSGARTILDVAVPSGGERISLDRLAEILPHIDLFVPNGDEARALTGEEDPDRQAKRLRQAGAAAVVVTMGPEGSFFLDADRSIFVAAPKVDVVDGSGAGDAFTAGLIAAWLEGWDMKRAIPFASVLGASACTRLGCTTGVFDRPEAERFVVEHALTSQPIAN